MSKKLLSVLLALALLVSSFAISAFAGMGDDVFETEADAKKYTQEWALGEPKDIGGGKYTVDVTLKANYLVGPMQFRVIKNVTAGTLKLTGAVESAKIPENWIANVAFKDASGEVAIIPEPTEYAVNAIDCSAGVVVATLTYTASADVAATLTIDVEDAKGPLNPDGTLIAARMEDGNVVTDTAITGQTVSQTTNTVTIGNAATPPQLVAIDGTLGVVDTSRTILDENEGTKCDGYVYGYDPENNSDVTEIVEVIGDGEINIVENHYSITTGTGAMIQVLDLDGNLVAEYVLIIFGDVNGDGFVDSNDASNIEQHENCCLDTETGELSIYLQFAADVNLDDFPDSNDASNVEQHENCCLDTETGQLDVAGIVDFYKNN